jgi:hypothetical protein
MRESEKVPHEQNWRSLFEVAKEILKTKKIKIKDCYNNALHSLIEELPEEYFYDQKTTTLYRYKNNYKL